MIKFEEKKSHRSSVSSLYAGIDYKTLSLKYSSKSRKR